MCYASFFCLGLQWSHLTEKGITTNTEEHIVLYVNLYLKAKKACKVAFCYLLVCAVRVKVYPFISLSVRVSFSSGVQFLYNTLKHMKCIVAVVRPEKWDQWYRLSTRIRILCFASKSALIGIHVHVAKWNFRFWYTKIWLVIFLPSFHSYPLWLDRSFNFKLLNLCITFWQMQ